MKYNIEGDAFSSGQIGSKIWLCESIESLNLPKQIIWLYGGWYATANFLLRMRGRIPVEYTRSFDIDPRATFMASMINENWVWINEFKAFTVDCNDINFSELGQFETVVPSLIINTSTEHFDSFAWFENIPNGIRLVLQCNDLDHDDHLFHVNSQQDMQKLFPLSKIELSDQLTFRYPTSEFTRYMLIGLK